MLTIKPSKKRLFSKERAKENEALNQEYIAIREEHPQVQKPNRKHRN